MRDSCNFEARALEESLNFVIDKVPGVCQGNQSNATGKSGKLAAVIGATKSSVTAQVAKLLRLFKIPQVLNLLHFSKEPLQRGVLCGYTDDMSFVSLD